MSNRKSSQQNQVRLWLAALKLRKDLLHLRLKANFNPNQARVPAGNPDGGRWTDDGGRTADSTSETGAMQRVVRDRSGDKPWRAYVEQRRVDGSLISTTVYNRDGSVIVSERPNAATERNTVTLRDGARFIFENSGDTQRIYDAAGNLISSAVWTPDGPVAQAIVQQALFDSRKPKGPLSTPIEVAVDAAIELYNWWQSTQEPNENTVFSFRADELVPVQGEPPLWTSKLKREYVEDTCPRFPLVQSMTNRVAKSLNPSLFKNPGAYGTAVHMGVKRMVDTLRDPNFTAEVSILKSDLDASRYGLKGTIRIDVIERREDNVVCVYDLKTGASGLSRARLWKIYNGVSARYKAARIIIIEVRPVR